MASPKMSSHRLFRSIVLFLLGSDNRESVQSGVWALHSIEKEGQNGNFKSIDTYVNVDTPVAACIDKEEGTVRQYECLCTRKALSCARSHPGR